MANADVASGLRPHSYMNGAPYNGQANRYYIPSSDATAVYLGAPVKLAGSADANGVPSVTLAASTETFVGIVVSVEPVTTDSTIYREASVERYVYVADDPQILFEAQEDSDTSTLAATSVGLNANIIGSGGSTVTGFSSIELDSSTAAVTATLDCQIMRLVPRANNEIGTNAKWLVKLNNHQFVDGTTGV